MIPCKWKLGTRVTKYAVAKTLSMRKDKIDKTKGGRRDDCFRPGFHEHKLLDYDNMTFINSPYQKKSWNPVNGTLVADKEIDIMNARREIRVRIPG